MMRKNTSATDRFMVTFNIEKHAVDALLREKYGHDGHHDY